MRVRDPEFCASAQAQVLHGLRELSPSPIIFVEYERRRYFNWFVVEMEEDLHVGSLARWQSSASRFAPPMLSRQLFYNSPTVL